MIEDIVFNQVDAISKLLQGLPSKNILFVTVSALERQWSIFLDETNKNSTYNCLQHSVRKCLDILWDEVKESKKGGSDRKKQFEKWINNFESTEMEGDLFYARFLVNTLFQGSDDFFLDRANEHSENFAFYILSTLELILAYSETQYTECKEDVLLPLLEKDQYIVAEKMRIKRDIGIAQKTLCAEMLANEQQKNNKLLIIPINTIPAE